MKYTVSAFIVMAVVISFLGWIVENTWIALRTGYIDNRNMNLPFLVGYGLFIAALYFLLGVPGEFLLQTLFKRRKNKLLQYLLYFLIVMVLVSVGEIILGTLVEKFCGFEYWNYLPLPLHITKYTSVPTSIAFAAMITLFMDQFFQPLMEFVSHIPEPLAIIGAVPLGLVLIADYLICFYKMYKEQKMYVKWRVRVPFLKERRRVVSEAE